MLKCMNQLRSGSKHSYDPSRCLVLFPVLSLGYARGYNWTILIHGWVQVFFLAVGEILVVFNPANPLSMKMKVLCILWSFIFPQTELKAGLDV